VRLRRLTAAVVGAAALAWVGTDAGPARAANTAVAVAHYQYAPDPVTVDVGDTITWVNHDAVHHDVTSVAGGPLASPELAAGDAWSVTFARPGTYAYTCSLHLDMTGTVVVVSRAPQQATATTLGRVVASAASAAPAAPVAAVRPAGLTAHLDARLLFGAAAAGIVTFALLAVGARRRRPR
jgi:plastocyanin